MADAPSLAAIAERLWSGEGAAERMARAALSPLEMAFRGVVRARDALYAAAVLPAATPTIPALSVGNLTVGGTGKTPVAAWAAGQLARRGGAPAIVLRGYGGDEPRVHDLLNPGIPVVANPDRAAGVAEAARRGADVAVLDDAFQHRRIRRVADVVLIAADGWTGRVRLLPAGPWREPLSALRRASAVVVTRKVASPERAAQVARALAPYLHCEVAILHLALGALRTVDRPGEEPLGSLRGAPVLAIAGVGRPDPFFAQLRAAGAVVDAVAFPDHHAYSAADARRLAARGAGARAICTLKDAVKLGPLWPRGAPQLHYVSQEVIVERGADTLDAVFDETLRARPNVR